MVYTCKFGSEIIPLPDLKEKEDRQIQLASLFAGQISFMIMLSNESNRRRYFKLNSTASQKSEDLFTTLSWSYSPDHSDITISTSPGTFEEITNINEYYLKLMESKSYWNILGIEDNYCDTNILWTAALFLNQFFQDNSPVMAIINHAKVELENQLKNISIIDLTFNIGTINVVVDGQPSGQINKPICLTDGTHTISLKSGDQEIGSSNIVVKAPSRQKIEIPFSAAQRGILSEGRVGDYFKLTDAEGFKTGLLVASLGLWPLFILGLADQIALILFYFILITLAAIGLVNRKKFGLFLLGICYVTSIFTGGFGMILSFIILGFIIYVYFTGRNTWT